jgi:hypothetical protein
LPVRRRVVCRETLLRSTHCSWRCSGPPAMGCGSSKDSSNHGDGQAFTDLNLLAHLPTTGPLSAKEYKARLATSEGTQTVHFPKTGITLRYAFVSQRGYYPGAPTKANQDSLCVHTHFGDSEQAFFGIFDGHGEFGTACSQYAKDKVRAAWHVAAGWLQDGMGQHTPASRCSCRADPHLIQQGQAWQPGRSFWVLRIELVCHAGCCWQSHFSRTWQLTCGRAHAPRQLCHTANTPSTLISPSRRRCLKTC